MARIELVAAPLCARLVRTTRGVRNAIPPLTDDESDTIRGAVPDLDRDWLRTRRPPAHIGVAAPGKHPPKK